MATRRGNSLPQHGAVHNGYTLAYPDSPQGKKLVELSNVAAGTAPVFEEAQRNRDLHQKRLNEMIEETLRQIHKTRLHMQQKSKYVRDTTSSYGAKFEHEIACVSEELKRDFESRATKLEGVLSTLEGRICELEGDLEEQHRIRVEELERTLGPIRDECARLTNALEAERRLRRRCEEDREKMLADEIEAFTVLIDTEKHEREQQLMEFRNITEREFPRLEKRQLQMETETTTLAEAQRHELRKAANERVVCQHGVIESVASFVKRYRDQVARDLGD